MSKRSLENRCASYRQMNCKCGYCRHLFIMITHRRKLVLPPPRACLALNAISVSTSPARHTKQPAVWEVRSHVRATSRAPKLCLCIPSKNWRRLRDKKIPCSASRFSRYL
ncbi:hypothetical protein BT93_C2349 [Corymbia citriodora subsp. variegata]|nr:hypothetical protein BT93_C2349 [Corymbia citriodora subsp. variegata]